MKLCASRAFWLVAYPSQGHEMLFDAHTRSFAALGGIARRGIYDNMKTAVDKVKKGKGRVVNARFAVMCAHYLFDADFCNVASRLGEGRRREERAGQPPAHLDRRAASSASARFAELNAWLGDALPGAVGARSRHPEHEQFSVAEMLEHERAQLMPMPEPFDGYVEKPARVSQHLPGGGGAQPLLGAVRAGRADGQHAAVPERASIVVADDSVVASHERLSDRRPDPLRLAALHPAGAEEARRACATARRSPTCPSRCSGCAGRCCATRAATA